MSPNRWTLAKNDGQIVGDELGRADAAPPLRAWRRRPLLLRLRARELEEIGVDLGRDMFNLMTELLTADGVAHWLSLLLGRPRFVCTNSARGN